MISEPSIMTGCQAGFFLLRNRCVNQCPSGFFLDVERSSCFKCHYACRECDSAFNCTSCFNDSELHRNGRCYAKELVEEVVQLERWYTTVSVVFLSLCFIILLLVVYIITDKNPQLFSSCRRSLPRSHFALRSENHPHHPSNTSSSLVVVDMKKMTPLKSSSAYSDEYHSEDDL